MMQMIALAIVVTLTLASGSAAAPSCAVLAERAAKRAGIPQGVMSAIALVETGRGGESWPWTLNEGGKGQHFDNRDQALNYLEQALAQGVTNIDIGCMQLNHRWHSAGFESPSDMLDPEKNTTYAALFLTELKKRLGSWDAAVAHYHSADPERGSAYLSKVTDAGHAVRNAPTSGDVSAGRVEGLLLAGTGPILDLKRGDKEIAEIVKKAANAAAVAYEMERRPVVIKEREELPLRLQRRWEALQKVRAALKP